MASTETVELKIDQLRQQVQAAESELRRLKLQLQEAELEAGIETRSTHHEEKMASDSIFQRCQEGPYDPSSVPDNQKARRSRMQLNRGEYKRYGRQLIMPEIGLPGQMKLKKARVLVVGVGGLGCPAAAYLAGAGIGTLGLMDGDTVELSNLHRQIAHSTDRIGFSKVDSAFEYLRSLNSDICINRHHFHLSPEKALSIFAEYDLILDCTDHPTSRYLISDACILTGKTLISASALKTDGQLIVLNNPSRPAGDVTGGPCYRCIFPKPPPADSVISCGEGGILGPVVGVMGVLQALEAVKILTKKAPDQHSSPVNGCATSESPKASMLMFSAYSNPQFRTVRLRSRRSTCAACSAGATVTMESLTSGSLDYIAFCGVTAPVNVLSTNQRISAGEFARLPPNKSRILIDTRDETQFAICALRDSVNVPWTGDAESWLEKAQQAGVTADDVQQTFVVCRFGNDSQLAVKALLDRASENAIDVKDIKGGLESWREEVDPEWPDY